MEPWLEHPAVQAGVIPFLVAVIVAVALRRGRGAWLAPTVAYVSAIVLTTGIVFLPLTAGRKVLLLSLLAPFAGAIVDRLDTRAARIAACVLAGAASAWAFSTVLAQRPMGQAVLIGLGIGAFVGLAGASMLRLRDDGPATAAAGLGLGMSVGASALLSASTGFFTAGIAVGAGAGALLAVQFVTGAPIRAGSLGALALATSTALFAAGTLMLAQLPWFVLPLLLAVPAVAAIPLPASMRARPRMVARTLVVLATAALPVAVAWFAARVA